MRWLLLLAALPGLALAFCPLGKPPADACPVDAPECLLFVDADGDGYCDNPGPRTIPDAPPDTTTISPPDTTTISPPDTVAIVPVDSVETVEDSLPVEEPLDTLPEPPDAASDSLPAPADTLVNAPDSTEAYTIATGADSSATGTLPVPLRPCPLQLPPAEACPVESPRCLFYNDLDADGSCNNPFYGADSVSAGETEAPVDTAAIPPADTLNGCPLSLPPEAACPSIDARLCPHFAGGGACMNPGGGGMTRAVIVLAGTALLLPVATILRRRLRGRRKSERRLRKAAHMTVHLLSLLVLGFLVRGCYCQLGAMQYLLLPGGLGFLGGVGVAILILPMIWSLFFGRIFCGWVCPFGALQDLLGKLNVPRPPQFPVRVRRFLIRQKFVLTALFLAAVFLAGRGVLGRIIPGSLWCAVDPFHTVFSLFVLGSFTGGVALLAGLIFLPRFFCQYLCFYGAVLGFLGRAHLYRRLFRARKRKD